MAMPHATVIIFSSLTTNHPLSLSFDSTPTLGVGRTVSLIRPTALSIVPYDKEVLSSSSSSSSVSKIKRKHSKAGSSTRVAVKYALSALSIISTISAISSPLPAYAAKKSAQQATVVVVEHLHTGQKIANYFRSFGIPDLAVLAIISAMPVVELRGAVPVGVWMGLPITKVLPVCVLGNMIPIVPILFLLRNDKLK
jgi:hypothetical protein